MCEEIRKKTLHHICCICLRTKGCHIEKLQSVGPQENFHICMKVYTKTYHPSKVEILPTSQTGYNVNPSCT